MNQFPGEDERVRLMAAVDEVDCHGVHIWHTVTICERCGLSRPVPGIYDWETGDEWDGWQS
jgi:hypothetical protein